MQYSKVAKCEDKHIPAPIMDNKVNLLCRILASQLYMEVLGQTMLEDISESFVDVNKL